jgi:uncharacterized protein YggE
MARFIPLLVALAALTAVPSVARSDDPPRCYVAVQGSGSVTATPDQAHINTGVSIRAETAHQALDTNNAVISRLMAALKKAGVKADDIRTRNFNVSPWYEPYVRNRPRVIAGYQASNQVQVKIRDIAKLGRILDAVPPADSLYQRPPKEEIRKRLTALQYKVTQEDGTEWAFNNAYWDNKHPGIYVDIVAG